MDSFIEWMYSFGEQYGVNPLIFALLYFGTIPLSLLSFSFLIRNFQRKKSLFFPILGMSLSFIGTYIYLFIVGKNIPIWVWCLIVGIMIYGSYILILKINRFKKLDTEEH